jgi:hypothetical protein
MDILINLGNLTLCFGYIADTPTASTTAANSEGAGSN